MVWKAQLGTATPLCLYQASQTPTPTLWICVMTGTLPRVGGEVVCSGKTCQPSLMNCLSKGWLGFVVPPRDSKAVGERICPVFTEALPSHVLCMWNSLLSQEQRSLLWDLLLSSLVSTAVAQTSSTLKDFFGFYGGGEWAVAIQREEFLMSSMFLPVPEKLTVWLPPSCASLSLWISEKLRGTGCSQSQEAHERDCVFSLTSQIWSSDFRLIKGLELLLLTGECWIVCKICKKFITKMTLNG